MKEQYYRLLTCREIRNACAHSSCIINNLKINTTTHRSNLVIMKALQSVKALQGGFVKNRMSNPRIQQIVTLLYVHKEGVCSDGLHTFESDKLHDLINRMFKHVDYYKDEPLITSSFNFLKIVIDNWFP